MRLRKIIKTRGHFPSDDAATKLLCLALRNITQDRNKTVDEWKPALNQFASSPRGSALRTRYPSL